MLPTLPPVGHIDHGARAERTVGLGQERDARACCSVQHDPVGREALIRCLSTARCSRAIGSLRTACIGTPSERLRSNESLMVGLHGGREVHTCPEPATE